MEAVTAWIVAGIFIINGEVSIQAHEQAFKTEADCKAFVKEVDKTIDNFPTANLPAYGQKCVEITVTERKPDLGKGKKTSL